MDEYEFIYGSHKPILPVILEKGKILQFKSWGQTEKYPSVIYTDFEAQLKTV